jgi:hypothetical protein
MNKLVKDIFKPLTDTPVALTILFEVQNFQLLFSLVCIIHDQNSFLKSELLHLDKLAARFCHKVVEFNSYVLQLLFIENCE